MKNAVIILGIFAILANSCEQTTEKCIESGQILEAASPVTCGQSNINEIFVGYWIADESTVKTVIFKDRNDSIQMVMWDNHDGEEMEIIKIQMVDNTIQTTEKMASTNWITNNVYSIIDENTLKLVIENDDGEAVIYLKRLK